MTTPIYPQFVSASIARGIFGVTNQTLRRWAASGKLPSIRTPGGQHRYDVSAYAKGAPVPKSETKVAKVAPIKVAAAPAKKVVEVPVAPVVAPMPKITPPPMDAATLRTAIERLASPFPR